MSPILNINTAISSLDNSTSLFPFFIKDMFDVTGRTAMAQNEGGKHEAREKFIEEFGTSVFWIGGIPLVRWVGNKLYKHKIDPEIHFKRINTEGIQSYFAGELKGIAKKDLEGIELKGKKLGEIKNKIFNAGFRPNETKGFYGKYHVRVTTAAVLINLAILSVVIPQLNLYLSRKIISKEVKGQKDGINKNPYDTLLFGKNKKESLKHFLNKINPDKYKKEFNGNKPSFGALKEFFEVGKLFKFTEKAEKAQLAPVNGMLILDYGISGSRVIVTPRNTNERVENFVKEGGIIFFFYYAAEVIKNKLCKLSDKLFNVPIDLDYKILNNPEFLNNFKNPHDKEDLLKFTETKDEETEIKGLASKTKDQIKDCKKKVYNLNELNVIKLIDNELAQTTKATKEENVFKNFTLKMAQKEGLIDVEYEDSVGKWIRHSKKYIETEKVIDLNNHLKTFYEKAFKGVSKTDLAKNAEKVISKTKKVKIAAIIGNVVICCASLSFIIPKIQYMIREHRTKTSQAPGILHYQEKAKKNLI